MSDDDFRSRMHDSVAKLFEDSPLDEGPSTFAQVLLFYLAGDVGDAAMYQKSGTSLAETEKQHEMAGNVLFYLATQPSQYGEIAEGLGSAGLAQGAGWRRIIIEKAVSGMIFRVLAN